jgi:hypothetical protein
VKVSRVVRTVIRHGRVGFPVRGSIVSTCRGSLFDPRRSRRRPQQLPAGRACRATEN